MARIESVSISALHPDPRNARTHDDRNLDAIKASLTAHGQQKPIVVMEDGTVLAGNGMLEAAKALGWEKIEIIRTALKGAQALAYAIADNRTAELADWNSPTLNDIIDELKPTEYNLDAMFNAKELSKILSDYEKAHPTEITEDDVPEPPKIATSQRGQMWTLGSHRLMCGDSSSAEDVEKLMAGKLADCVFTDPPYGVSIGTKNKFLNTFQKAGMCCADIEADTKTPDELYKVLLAVFKNCRAVANDCCAIYVCSPQGGGLGMMMMMMMQDAGLQVRHVLNWIKNSPTFSLGRLDYDYQHEPILFTWTKTHKKIMAGQHRTSCWFIDKPRESKCHPTMKPIAIPANAIHNSSEEGDVILDLFGGSGTTLIAAEHTGRRCYMMEIDPIYVDVIIKRWETLTGKQAVLNG